MQESLGAVRGCVTVAAGMTAGCACALQVREWCLEVLGWLYALHSTVLASHRSEQGQVDVEGVVLQVGSWVLQPRPDT